MNVCKQCISDRAEQTGNALKLGEYGIAYLEF